MDGAQQVPEPEAIDPQPSLPTPTPPSPSRLTDELSRRLRPPVEQAELQAQPAQPQQQHQQQQQQLQPQQQPQQQRQPQLAWGAEEHPALDSYLSEPRHDEPSALAAAALTHIGGGGDDEAHSGSQGGALAAAQHAQQQQREGLVSKWRQKERLKTTAVALVVCLNIGVDPPDVIKISPCARLECWVDPLSMQAPKALDTIGKNLQAQYERWQPRAKYKMHLDPTTEDVKKLAISCRRTAKNERVLFHYNGHGVPRPTANGEIWVFNKSYTQYIPLSIFDLQTWVGSPAIYVFDCSAAGQILNSFKQFMFQRQQEAEGYMSGQAYPHTLPQGASSASLSGLGERADPMRDCILLCACSESEVLPQNPDLPADVFTSCLTTPIKVALRWFCSRSLLRHEGVTKELIDRIPGKQTDRKTPLGELNWIFTAITDTIAWNVLPRALFQKLFRQDLLVASLFRNFLLAERIMRGANCSPCTYPRLPPTHQHPMWQAWDMAAEMCLLQLPELLGGEGGREYQPSPFFSEQLTAFELWLEHGSPDKKPPEQLPIVLQVLLSQVHRLRALVLLGRFLDMGSWAVDLALSVGIFPYVLKLLQTTATDLRQTLVFIWAKIMAWDANAQVQSDLVKDSGHSYFIKHLESRDPGVTPESRAQAAFVLAAICNAHPKGQQLCAQAGLCQVCLSQLPATLVALRTAQQDHFVPGTRSMALLVKWLLLCLGKLCEDNKGNIALALRDQAPEKLAKLLGEDNPEVRAAAAFALGAFIQAHEGDSSGGGTGSPPAPTSPGSPPTPGSVDGPSVPPLSEQERLAMERAVACALLEVVYDGSPLVRAEVATALARLAVGHSLFFQDAVHAHQRTSARIMHGMRSTQGLVGSAPAETSRSAPGGVVTSLGSQGLPVGASAPHPAPPMGLVNGEASSVGKGAGSTGPEGAPTGSSFSPSSSPGVRLRDDLAYEPMLSVGLEQAHLGGVYASADAARVGGGLYLAVVEALCTLATDPSPRVAAAGQAALRAANVELVEIPSMGPGLGGKVGGGGSKAPSVPTSPRRAQSSQSSVSLGTAASVSSLLPRSWQPKPWLSRSSTTPPPPAAAGGGAAAVSGSAASSPNASPSNSMGVPSTYTRASFILRRAPDAGDLAHAQSAALQSAFARQLSSQSVASSSGGGLAAYDSRPASAHPSSSALLEAGRRAPGGAAGALLRSGVYATSCQRFTWPLLAQQGGDRVDEEEGTAANAPWAAPPDPAKLQSRLRRREEDLERCQLLAAEPRQARLKETVLTVATGAERNTVVMLDPFKPLVTSVDGDGIVRVSNYVQPGTVNRFHVATGDSPYDVATGQRAPAPPATVTALFQLNEVSGSLLMTCAADGAVRVWRDYSVRGGQRMATAWQSVLVASQGMPCKPAVFEWSARYGTLFAAGGRLAERVYIWNLERECCNGQLAAQPGAPASAAGPEAPPASSGFEHLACLRSSGNPVLFAADGAGVVRIFDLRAGSAVGSTQHLKSRLAGMVVEPGGKEHQLVLGYPGGQLSFLDCRVISSQSAAAGSGDPGAPRVECGVWKSLEAHSKGPMATLCAHAHVPLLATATAQQVVKLWSAAGEQVAVMRTHTSFLSERIGPATCMAFSPYDTLLALGGIDSIVTVYRVEAGGSAGGTPSASGGASGSGGRSVPSSPLRPPPLPQPPRSMSGSALSLGAPGGK